MEKSRIEKELDVVEVEIGFAGISEAQGSLEYLSTAEGREKLLENSLLYLQIKDTKVSRAKRDTRTAQSWWWWDLDRSVFLYRERGEDVPGTQVSAWKRMRESLLDPKFFPETGK